MSTAKIERNKQMCKWYFEEDKSTYHIAEILSKESGTRIAQTTVWEIIKRDAHKFGYVYPKA